MKREFALPVIAVSAIMLGCKDASAPADKTGATPAVSSGKAAVVVSSAMKGIQSSALDASSRLTLSMTTSSDVTALRSSLADIANFAAIGNREEALASAKAASALLAKVDPAERNPDAAAIRLVIIGAINKLSH